MSPTPEPKTEDEAQQIKRFLQAGGQVALKEVEAVKARGGAQATAEKPGILAFPATIDHFAAAISSSTSRRITLQLVFSGLNGSEQFSAAVFINKLDASVQTTFEDPAFVGGVGFFVHSMESMPGMTDTHMYEIDITTPLARMHGTGTVTATLVLHALGRTPPPTGLAIQSATLRVLDSTVKRSS